MPTKKTRFIAIAACAENGVIGNKNKIPWHLPEDFRWFKQTTMGHLLVMGRKTFESIGKPLPGRKTIVLSRSGITFPDVETVKSFHDLWEAKLPRKVFIVGGGEIYAQALLFCNELLLTLVKGEYEGDTYFPEFDESLFRCKRIIQETDKFTIIRYYSKKNVAPPKKIQRQLYPVWGLKKKRLKRKA